MIDVLDTIKQAYDKSTTQIDKIVLNGQEYRISNVEYYDDVYEEGNIFGTAIAKCLDFEIENTVNLEGQEIEYLTGIIENGTTQWISLGNFIIQDVQPNDTTNIAKVTAMDYMLKTNIPYVSELNYGDGTVTLLDVLQEVCTKSGLTLATVDFTNSTFIVDSNQFAEGTLNRQVIQEVAQVSGTVAKIRNNQLYLINPNTITTISKVFTLNSYKEAEIKRTTHPINLVSLGMADVEGENITLRDETSIEKNGENSLVINDNPFAYTQAKREQLITALFDAVKGFEYKAYSFKDCQGLPYLETLDKIQFKDKEGNTYDSFIFRFNNKSPNGLESTIEAPSITKATVAYQNIPDALEIAKRTEIIVDKQNQTIQAVIEETNEIQSQVTDITTTQATKEGTEIKIDDSAEEPIIKLEVDGASWQDGTPTPEVPVEIQSVGDDVNLFDINEVTYRGGDTNLEISGNHLILTATGTTGAQMVQNFVTDLDSSENYTLSFKAKKNVLGTDGDSVIRVRIYGSNDNSTYTSIAALGLVTLTESKEYYFFGTVTGYTSYRLYVYNNTSTPVTIGEQTEYYDIKFQKGTVATPYSEYGKGTVEIKQSGKNLFNINELTLGYGDTDIIIEDDKAILTATGTIGSQYVKNYATGLDANKNYTFSYKGKKTILGTGGRPYVQISIYASNDDSTYNLVKNLVETNPIEGKEYSFSYTVTGYTSYAFYIYNNAYNSVTIGEQTEYYDIQFEEGTETTEDEQYKANNYVIPTTPLRSLPNGVCDTIEEDGIHRRVGSVVLDGTLHWVYIASGGYMYLPKVLLDLPHKANGVGICTHFIFSGSSTDLGYFRLGNNYAFMMYTEYTDREEWHNWLSQNPIQVDYELAEEVIEPFDEEQQEVIDSISTMLGIQYFTCDANMRITYVRDNGLTDMYETKNNAIRKYAQQEMKLTETGALIESLVSVTNALNDGFKVGDEELQKQLEELGKNLEDYQLTTSTSFEQTEKNFQMKFNELIESINTNAEGNSEKFAEIVKYIRFEDGNIVLGRSDNELILKIQNDRISYQQNGTEVAYFSDNKLYVTTLEVTHSLQLGNFAFIPRANGNLSFKKVGGN